MSRNVVEGFSLTHAQVLSGSVDFLTALAQQALEEEDIYGVNDASLDPDTGDYENEGDDDVLSVWSWINFADVGVQAGYMSFPLIASLTGQTVQTADEQPATNEVQTISMNGATAGDFTITVEGETTAPIAYNATNTAVSTALQDLPNVDTNDIAVSGSTGTYVLTFGGRYAARNVPTVGVDSSGLTGGPATVEETTKGHPAFSETLSLDLWHEDSMNVPPKPMVVKMPSRDTDGQVRQLAIGLYKVQFRPVTFDGPSYKDGLKVNYAGRAVKSAVDEMGSVFADGKKRVGKVLSFT